MTSATAFDKKLLIGMVLICVAIGAVFGFVYLDMNANLRAVRQSNSDLSARLDQLQATLEALHENQTASLPPVQIYNLTKHSVVLITNRRTDDTIAEASGFVYDPEGHIVTNNHVVDRQASLTVTFLDGTTESAELIGTDVYTDLAVVKVQTLPEQAHPLILADSSELLVGEAVYAIGNPLRLTGSMTAGIVSQLGRVLRLSDLGVPPPWGNYSIVDVIQSDAAINPGNSGGPLLNSLGFVVGVTFAIETADGGTGFIGIGYAVPSILASRAVPSIIATGQYVHPWLGVELTDMTPELAAELHTNYTAGALIASVLPGSPASAAGLQADDIIIEVRDAERTVAVTSVDPLLVFMERYESPGDTVTLKIVRNSVIQNVDLTLGERPI